MLLSDLSQNVQYLNTSLLLVMGNIMSVSVKRRMIMVKMRKKFVVEHLALTQVMEKVAQPELQT